MKIGLVILNYKDADRTLALAGRAAAYPSIDEICLVDNASPDDSFERLQEFCAQTKRAKALRAEENGGYAKGNNLGLRYLMQQRHCSMLMIANPDVSFEESVVVQLREAFASHPEYGVLSPRMKNADGTYSDRPYLQLPTFLQGVGLCFYSFNRIYERLHPYDICDDGDGIMTVDAVQGSLWAVRAEALERAGFLDEETFLFYEEMAFAMRLRANCPEYKEGLLLGCEYLHNHSASIRSVLSEMNIYRIYMQSKLYYEEHYHHAAGLRRLILRLAIAVSVTEKRCMLMLRSR